MEEILVSTCARIDSIERVCSEPPCCPGVSSELLSVHDNLSKKYVKTFPKEMPNSAEIRFRTKTIVTSLPRDIYSDRPKDNTIIKFSLSVIHMS